MEEQRTNPDELLRIIHQEEAANGRGRLKIFFGYAAGVGKTYAMLKAAHAALHHGADVVVGYVEPHTRPQTIALLNGLEQLPPKAVTHGGITLREFDLDAALARKPALLVVDELAHTNADGCRHAKRYQDVEELLKAGIDVYTTVNVQHIESLNDIVASITGVLVRERIPDKVFDNADQVKLVDLEPQELIERLNEGKVYQKKQAEQALGNFFSVQNLTALREIALRRCADRVNKLSDRARVESNSTYYTDEHILVCLSSSPTNAKIIRTAARMAHAFRGSFTALFVETPDFSTMSEENRKRLRANIHLAEQLGATVETVFGDDTAFQISEFARLSGVSKIVVGRSNLKRKFLFRKPTLTEKLISYSPNLDIYIIPDEKQSSYQPPRLRQKEPHSPAADLVKSVGLLLAASALGTLFFHMGFRDANIITVYILSVLVTALVTSRRIYCLLSSVISVLVFNFFFTEPRFSLNAYDTGYPATFVIMFAAAFLTGTLAEKMKQQTRESARNAFRTKVLFDTNQLLQKAQNRDAVISATANQLTTLLGRNVVFYPAENGILAQPLAFPAAEGSTVPADCVNANEQAVAAWVLKNNKHAGATTSTLANAKCLYLAVRVNENVYGVVGIVMGSEPLDAFDNSIVLSMLGECALALESEKAAKEREEAAVLAKNEQLRANLLRSISHDLRTPLTAISGNAGVLLEDSEALNTSKRRQLYQDIYDDSLWLINLVENLLSVTRIEDGSMHLRLTTELLDEVVAEALRHIGRKLSEHHLVVTQPEDFLLVKVDAHLIVQVLINLIDNAVKYTPPGSTIAVTTRQQGKLAVVEVADNGPGIPDNVKPRVFDRFYTANSKIADSRRSMGLGLALCKSIIHAHGGEITVCDNQPAGAVFRFTLPTEEVTLHE